MHSRRRVGVGKPPAGEFEHPICAHDTQIVGVLVAEGNREDAGADHVGQRVGDARGIATIGKAMRQSFGDRQATLGHRKQHDAAVLIRTRHPGIPAEHYLTVGSIAAEMPSGFATELTSGKDAIAAPRLGCRRQRGVPRCGFGARQSLYRGEDTTATGGNSPKPSFGHQRAPLARTRPCYSRRLSLG